MHRRIHVHVLLYNPKTLLLLAANVSGYGRFCEHHVIAPPPGKNQLGENMHLCREDGATSMFYSN